MSDLFLQTMVPPVRWSIPSPLPPPITTERTLVRLYDKGDGPKLFRAIDAHRASLLPWLAWPRTDHLDEDDSIFFVETHRRARNRATCNDFPFGIFDRATGEILGGTGLHRVHFGLHEAEIGYWIRGDKQGTGLCTEAIAGLITAAFKSQSEGGWGLRRLVITNASENIASRRVCEKLGLRQEMHLKQARYIGPVEEGNPGWVDHTGYGVLAEEWDTRLSRKRT